MLSRFTPLSRPVEMVVPERDRPGSTAQAWPRPTTKAGQKLMPLRLSFIAACTRTESQSDKVRSRAVTSRHTPTTRIELKAASTWSLKNMRSRRCT